MGTFEASSPVEAEMHRQAGYPCSIDQDGQLTFESEEHARLCSDELIVREVAPR
jgi:hypothetical protein